MSTLSPLPKTASGQIAWKEFFASAKSDQAYVIPLAKRWGCISAKSYTGRNFATRSNGDGTFTLTFIGEPDPRHDILADFANLSTGVLKALHEAATKSGLFAESKA